MTVIGGYHIKVYHLVLKWALLDCDSLIQGVSWNAPKRMWRRYFSRESICNFSWNAPKSNIFIFGSFLVFKSITCFFLEMPHFFLFVFPEMPHFSHFQNQIGKMGHFRKNELKKVGHFEKKTRDRFENEKRTENEYVRFWGISGKNTYALTWKIPPSNAFWGISRYLPYKSNGNTRIISLMSSLGQIFHPNPKIVHFLWSKNF